MANLPEWGRDDLPTPLPFSARNVFRVIGPGAILLATSIGGGEWLVGPAAAVKHGVGLMWIATVGIVLQLMLNLEGIRYTLYTGEPILNGIMRLRPGANFWGTFYVVLAIAQLGVPALAKASAAVIFTAAAGHLPQADGSNDTVLVYITYGIILLGVLILMFGGTIERILEYASWAMIAYIFVFLLAVNLYFVPWSHTRSVLVGFARFGYLPHGIDWLILASLAATAGSGGIGNLAITNWIRDKGLGMGGRVGAIPSAVGGRKIELSHVGKVFPVNAENLSRWRTWWKYVVVDQVWLWGLGCFLGMFLNVNLATAIISPETDMKGPAAGAIQAEFMAQHLWRGLWYLGLLNGFWILFSTHLGNTDILVRTVTDIVWSASSRVRSSRRLHVGRLYYGLLFGLAVWGAIVVPFGTAMELFQILAAIAGLVLVPAGIQILRVNTRLLPEPLRPSWWRRGALVACSLFYAAVCALVLWSNL